MTYYFQVYEFKTNLILQFNLERNVLVYIISIKKKNNINSPPKPHFPEV
jgi:hypothetical protein